MKRVEIFTDGACSGNPGPGGWGAILRLRGGPNDGHVKELSGGEAETTNNRMELMAAISALSALKEPVAVDLYTDSNYVREGIGGWIEIHGQDDHGLDQTLGCIMLDNSHVAQLYEQVSPGTPVTIVGALDVDNRVSRMLDDLAEFAAD